MTNNMVQIELIVAKLLEKTEQGGVAWESSLNMNSFQARFGSYIVRLSGSGAAGLVPSIANGVVTIKVTQFTGSVVAEASTISLIAPQLSNEGGKKLLKLYAIVSDRSSELDELLDLI